MKVGQWIRLLLVPLVMLLLLAGDGIAPGDEVEQVRVYTRSIEFDYINWTLQALGIKTVQSSLQIPQYIDLKDQRRVVSTNLQLVSAIDQVTGKIDEIYADPAVQNPAAAAAQDTQQLEQLREIERQVQPVAEAVIQKQVTAVLADEGLTLGGQPIPPVMYHTTPLPMALIISPRDVIRQDANISLVADLTTPQAVELEKEVEKNLNVSALVVPVGGVGVYPTMVMSTTDLPWLLETVSHEWTHNFLTLRPLGINYETTPQLRTMNETTASIVGKEIGLEVLKRYYPELAPKPPAPTPEPAQSPQAPAPTPEPTQEPEPPKFDYRAEMHLTRVTVDQLLADGKIQEAEDYMEMRRRFFWDHGYQIRRLNQAYFAFYGAYADVPGGAAGKDPVGPAVRALRAQSKSLADFVNRISWMTSFEQLQKAVGQVQ